MFQRPQSLPRVTGAVVDDLLGLAQDGEVAAFEGELASALDLPRTTAWRFVEADVTRSCAARFGRTWLTTTSEPNPPKDDGTRDARRLPLGKHPPKPRRHGRITPLSAGESAAAVS